MPGTRRFTPFRVSAALALAVLLALPACSGRRPIPSDPPPAPAAQAPAAAELQAPPAAEQPAAAGQQAAPTVQDQDTAGQQAAPAPHQYFVQIGSFGTEKNAEGALTWLKGKGYDKARMVRLEQGAGVFFRVQAGPYPGIGPAQTALEKLRADWPKAFILGD